MIEGFDTSENVRKVLCSFAPYATKELVDVVVESVEALENEITRLTPLAEAALDIMRVQTERADKAEAELAEVRAAFDETRHRVLAGLGGEHGKSWSWVEGEVERLRRALKGQP